MAKMGKKPRIVDPDQFYSDFPGLNKNNHRVTSPATESHNCIAFVIGDKYHNWWPGVWVVGTTKWPNACPTTETVEAFASLFATKEYQQCKLAEISAGHETIALYTKKERDDQVMVPTHAAIQISNRPGWWKSKISDNVDIEHTLAALNSDKYGEATHFFSRLGSRRLRRKWRMR